MADSIQEHESDSANPEQRSALLVGQPNVGKTTMFNCLCGLRAHTANVAGSTVDARVGQGYGLRIIDLPGTWSLALGTPEAEVVKEALHQEKAGLEHDVAIVVVDGSSLRRGLHLAVEVLREGRPCVVAVNLIDQARRKGIEIDQVRLEERLGCSVVFTSARHQQGIDDLAAAVANARGSTVTWSDLGSPEAIETWVEGVLEACSPRASESSPDKVVERLDHVLTHPFLGVLVFAAVMIGLFWTIFEFASIPMDLIELIFGYVGQGLTGILPEGELRNLIVDGVVGGLAGTVVFLPQILLLFFLIALLEDTGYLARAAFVMDRILRRFGLPGQAFVPMLSAHACAIPAIMAARLVPDRRDRLATILVAPFLSCSARLPVYVLLIGVLFIDQPLLAGIVFAGCYVLGILAAMLSSLLVRKTILKGPSRPFVIELPPYQWPSLRGALLTCWDRGILFIRNAGTVILAMVIVLWWLSSYPKLPDIQTENTVAAETSALEYSFAGRIGQTVQPVFEPMDWDWQLTVGVMSSFAAREVFVSTMAVLVAGHDDTEDAAVLTAIAEAKRDDGRAMLTTPVAASLLVFFVLAMQCLPTLAVTARESGGWKWAILQFVWMSGVAWLAAWLTFVVVVASGAA
jgi:ferrous iron transport protein B